MNMIGSMLQAPWRASTRSSRWTALGAVVICALSMASALYGLQGHKRIVLCAFLWCLAIGAWWLLVAANALLLARDATTLCLPALRRTANLSVVANALLTVLLPALVLAAVLGQPLFWLVAFSLTAAACMLFLLLPSGVVAVATIGLSVGFNLWAPKAPSSHALLAAAGALALASIALAARQWSYLLRRDPPAALGYNVPLIWSLRLQSIHGFGMRRANMDVAMARVSRTWLAPVPDLRGLGPARPARSIRVALGRSVMPQTPASLLRQIALAILFILVFTVLPLAVDMHQHDFRAIVDALILPRAGAPGIPVIIACVVTALAAVTFPLPVRARWSAGAAELPLLALLPGLGDVAAARRHVVSAALMQTQRAAAIEFLVLCALGAWAHVLPGALVFSALGVACTVALAAACILGELAARPLSRMWLGVLACVLLTVLGIAMGIGFSGAGFDAHTWPPLAGALLLLLALLLALCRRGWHAYARRPHPFLAGVM